MLFFTNKPRHVQLAILGLAIFAFNVYWFAPVTRSALAPYLKSTYILGVRVKEAAVEIEGLKIGPPFDEINATVTGDQRLQKLNLALLTRYANLDIDTSHAACPIDLARYESTLLSSAYKRKTDSQNIISIALNLFNSEKILPSLSLALLETIHHLQPNHQIYISIFENGSKDKTLALLGHLAAALLALEIDGVFFRHSILTRPEKVERIIGLANLRNEALYPLFPTAGDGIVLFVNDVATCGSDLLELVHQLRLQNAHGVMSTDWFINRGNGTALPQFRDVWVARGINGEMPYIFGDPGGFSPRAPTGNWVRDLFLTQSPEVHDRWVDGRPIPMYSGWNGAMAFDAKLFTEYHVRFRGSGKAHWTGGDASGALGKWGELLATPGYLESDCSASECKLFARDVWNLMKGHARILLAPQSRTGYTLEDYEIIAAQAPATRRTGVEGPEELIDWSNVTMPSGVVCVPSLGEDGKGLDVWGASNTRHLKDPRTEEWT